MRRPLSLYRTETWAAVRGHPNYEVSSEGHVKSLHRVITDRIGRVRVWRERLLTCHANAKGYYSIVLDGKGVWLHKLVARAFHRNPERRRCVNHKDGDKSNNRACNLEWASHAENMNHAYRTGLCPKTQGSTHHWAKLTESDILVIRDLAVIGLSHAAIARRYRVCGGTIDQIASRKIWKHVL